MKLYERAFYLLSAGVNVVFFGGDWPESLSARCWRQREDPDWFKRMTIIDRWLGQWHCFRAYEAQNK